MSEPREPQPPVFDPYRAPKAPLRAPAADDASIRLFGPASVAIAGLFGTAIAGGILIALNYAAMRRYAAMAVAALIVGPTLFGLLTSLVAYSAGPQDPGWQIALNFVALQSAAAAAVGDMLQGRFVRARLRAGQALASRWLALIVAIVSLPLVAVIGLPIVAATMR